MPWPGGHEIRLVARSHGKLSRALHEELKDYEGIYLVLREGCMCSQYHAALSREPTQVPKSFKKETSLPRGMCGGAKHWGQLPQKVLFLSFSAPGREILFL